MGYSPWGHMGCVCVCAHSVMSNFVTPSAVVHQVPLLIEFSGQEYWSWLPFLSPGEIPSPGMEPPSLALATEPPGSPQSSVCIHLN